MHKLGIGQSRADAAFDLFERQIGCDQGRQAVDVAEVQDLEQLLPRPLGGVLGSEIIEDEQGCLADLFEALLKSHVFCVVGEAQRIEHVRHSQEERRDAQADALIGDGRRQVGLAAAVGAAQQQPSTQVVGVVLADLIRLLERLLMERRQVWAPVRVESIEGHVLQLGQVAQAVQLLPRLLPNLRLTA